MKHRLIWGLLTAMAPATLAMPARAADEDAIKRAVERGVTALRRLQSPDGTWPHTRIGATALAGLALLECGAAPDDNAVLRAADAVRKATVNNLDHTYSISLAILFLDRLGDPADVPLIESLMVRLMAGQDPKSGGWTYDCPKISAAEVKRLDDNVRGRKKDAVRRDDSAPTKRKFDDLAPEIREQLRRLARGELIAQPEAQPAPGLPLNNPAAALPNLVGLIPGDNSNTQFAALGLWVGRRHGLPVETAIERLNRRFRTSQQEDGGWAYVPITRPPGMPAHIATPGIGSTPAMTCAGVLALAICDGAILEYVKERKPDAKLPDISQDKELNRGLEVLGSVIADPKGLKPQHRGYHPQAPQPDRVGGKSYYFLWSLERVAVALDLKTIGKKDWYGWGAEILLENQSPDGTWSGEYGEGGVDTCFALLFLKRANLARDLTASIKGMVKDPGERVLKGGGFSIEKPGAKKMKSGIETLNSKPIEKPATKPTDAESARLTDALLKAKPSRRMEILETMESEKGVKYTEALAIAIPKLEGASRDKAREALANRLARMKDGTLSEYLQDDDAEIRRAAALAIAAKDSKELVPNLIELLRDPETSVARAAHAALKALTEQDFGPAAKATREERDQAVLKWINWWSKKGKKSGK